MNRVMIRAKPLAGVDGQRAQARTIARCGLPPASLPHLEKSLKKQWKRYRKELRRCQEKFSENAIHDSRVQTRRLLSIVELLGGFIPTVCVEKIESALKEHLDTFDDLRDTQVQLPMVRKLARTFVAGRPFCDYLVEREERFSRQTRKQIKQVKTGRVGKLIAAAREDVQEKGKRCSPERASAILLRSLDRAFARAVQLRARIDPSDTRTIHCTRVAFKKFRYMVEALADYLPAANDRMLAAMHHYQTMMGNIQDAEVLLRTWDKFIEKRELPPDQARRLREELVRRRQWLIKIYLHAAGQLTQFWPLSMDRDGAAAAPAARTRSLAKPKSNGGRR